MVPKGWTSIADAGRFRPDFRGAMVRLQIRLPEAW